MKTKALAISTILLAATFAAAQPMQVSVDIKPQSCPNPLNVNSKGVLTVAVLGTESFDVNTINAASVLLAGLEPLSSSYEDVAAPVADNADCNCTENGPDGFIDLVLKFKTQDISAAISPVEDGAQVVLTLTGALTNQTPIEGTDCVVIIKKEGQPE
jgi:hypothetical protein